MTRGCYGCQDVAQRGPVVAIWITQGGNQIWLCHLCVDDWFDWADDDVLMEPALVSFASGLVLQAA